jgi:hypothetical protein
MRTYLAEAQRKRDEKEAAGTGRRGRKRKNSAPEPAPQRGKKSCAEEVEEAREEIKALRMEGFVLSFNSEHH